MEAITFKLRPPLKTHGGKAYLARRIVAKFPLQSTYVEPFVGGASVLLNKPPAAREVAGDLDPDLIHFWRALQDPSGALRAMAEQVPYTEAAFD